MKPKRTVKSPWIKIEHRTPDKPEVIALMSRCGLTQGEVFLACFQAWVWWDRNSADGNAPSVALSVLENHLDQITGHPGFGRALTAVGWLAEKDGIAIMPGFDRHQSKGAKNLSLANRRVENHCDGRNAPATPPPTECNAPSVTPPLRPRYQIREECTDLPPTPSPGEGAFPEMSGKDPEDPAEAGPPLARPPAGCLIIDHISGGSRTLILAFA